MVATITTGWLILIFFGGLVVFFFLLGKLTQGTGADLVDWDPFARDEERRALEAEDLRQLRALQEDDDA